MKYITKKDSLYPFITYIRRKRKALFWKLSHIKCVTIFSIIAVAFLVLSFYLRFCNPWLSQLFQALSVGIVTGLIVYILGNMRGQKESYLGCIIKQLDEIYQYEHQVYNTYPSLMLVKSYSFDKSKQIDYSEYLYKVFEAAQNYIDALKKMEFSLLTKFLAETKTDIQKMQEELSDIIDSIPEEVTYSSGIKIVQQIITLIRTSADWIEEARQNAEIQQQQIKKYPL